MVSPSRSNPIFIRNPLSNNMHAPLLATNEITGQVRELARRSFTPPLARVLSQEERESIRQAVILMNEINPETSTPMEVGSPQPMDDGP